MSLFEDDRYRWRETYFVLFRESNRPLAKAVEQTLKELGGRYEIAELKADEQARFESLTLHSPYDYAAMDIAYLAGDDVRAHVDEIMKELKESSLTKLEKAKLKQLEECDARFDIYHFEQLVDEEEDEYLDPGALLIVLERLAKLANGVGIDPQSGALM
jgi:hypothetical protein